MFNIYNLPDIILVFSFLKFAGISQLNFTTEPHDVVALHGEPLLLECRVTGDEQNEGEILITWRYQDVEISQTNRTYILDDGSLYFEEIVADDDRGRYQCCAQNTNGVICSRNADVSIASKYHELGPIIIIFCL